MLHISKQTKLFRYISGRYPGSHGIMEHPMSGGAGGGDG